MSEYFIAWWNLENLFDVWNSAARPPYLNDTLKSELQGWNEQVLAKKTSQLSQVIRQMNDGKGPDLLGVCEVENKPVVEGLVKALAPLKRKYKVAHHDTS